MRKSRQLRKTAALLATATMAVSLAIPALATAQSSTVAGSERSFPAQGGADRKNILAEATSISSDSKANWGGIESLTIEKTDSPAEVATKEAARKAAEEAAAAQRAQRAQAQKQAEVSRSEQRSTVGVMVLKTSSNVNLGTYDPAWAGTYPFGQCTWWVAIRRAQIGRPVPGNMGNGKDWANSARAHGMKVDHTPEVGAVLVFQPGQLYADPVYGHVAFVEQVLDDGSIITSETSGGRGGVGFSRHIYNASVFEYVH